MITIKLINSTRIVDVSILSLVEQLHLHVVSAAAKNSTYVTHSFSEIPSDILGNPRSAGSRCSVNHVHSQYFYSHSLQLKILIRGRVRLLLEWHDSIIKVAVRQITSCHRT